VDGVHIAYQVFGEGPVDVVFSFGEVSNVDQMWDLPEIANVFRRLASFSRVIAFDPRGNGCSDRDLGTASFEAGMDDIRAVMDAAKSERAILLGAQDGGMICALFAASFPERSAGLILLNSSACGLWAADYPWGWTEDEWDEYMSKIDAGWGTLAHAEEHLRWMAPNSPVDAATVARYARYFRSAASPGSMVALERMVLDSDVRAVLPTIQVPTLVLHEIGNPVERVEQARYIAERIHGSTLVELPFDDHMFFWDAADAVIDNVERFARRISHDDAEFDRVLATVLFTDIVDSTAQSAAMGDRAWTEIHAKHDQIVRASLARFRGREIKTMGDGFLATFDGPARGVRCAEAIASGLEPLGIEIRAGLHTGEVALDGDDVSGLGVAIGARVGAKAAASEVLVSQTVKDRVAGSGLVFEDAGEHELKGVPDSWRLTGWCRGDAQAGTDGTEGRARPLEPVPGAELMVTPQTRFAKTSDGVHVAYQVVGDGPVDLVWVMGWTSNVEAIWEEPNLARFLSGLSSFARLLLFDKRGVGLSDRVPETQLPSMETRMDDVRAVMDAAGSERAVVFGVSEGGPMAMLFAATYPERTIALILYGTDADYTSLTAEDPTVAENEEYLRYIDEHWGTLEHARLEIASWGAPSHADDQGLATWLASYLRRSASPGAAIALSRMNRQIDVSHVIPAIHVPTLVIAKTEDVEFPIERLRGLTAEIAGARLVEIPGDEHFFWVGDYDTMLKEIERFVTEFRDQEAELERFLATVLFTDIVDSTSTGADMGDHAWKELAEAHHVRVRGQLSRFRGREIDTAGDGFFATFDGPGRGIRCALAIVDAVRGLGIEVRAGLHTGECEQIGDKVGGIAVNIGARIASRAGPSEVLVSQTVKDLTAGSGLLFDDAGEHELKGVPGPWRLFRVVA
jgi:pimeloyl-ACP methyl ester carboxylesterase